MSERKSTIKIDTGDGERFIHMKKRFPSTALSRFGEAAPDLLAQVMDLVRKPVQLAVENKDMGGHELNRLVNSEFDNVHDYTIKTTIDELNALHELCVEATDKVEGFVDWEGDPFVWKNQEEHAKRIDLYDCDVSNVTKITIAYYCCLLKSGNDPDDLRRVYREKKEKELADLLEQKESEEETSDG